ncbi:hypothetical protein ACQ4PT_032944 [Festuca glaucescens]
MVKLDRVLFNENWDTLMPNCMLQALSSEMSDHCPILLSRDAGFMPVRHFRFENSWAAREDFASTVQQAWDSCPTHVDPFINLHVRLAATAKALSSWSSQFASDLVLRAAISNELILKLDQTMDGRQSSQEEMQFRDGEYSATSDYDMQFEGSTCFSFHDTIWNNGARLKCRVFAWLAVLGKCHTADCLMKKRWPHNAPCVLCLSDQEMALHLLATCSVTRRLWEKVLATAQLPVSLVPGHDTAKLQDWLGSTQLALPIAKRKGWFALVQLTWWSI